MKQWLMILPGLIMATGCDNDERLERMARETVQSQREQNRMIAEHNNRLIDQSKEVVQHGRELAKTAEQLVEKDAEARREMIVAHKEMRTELHEERVSVDQQRENLDEERQAIARQRVMQPILAEAIKAVGLWLACLLPVGLAGYLFYTVNRDTEDQAVLNEMLVLDLTADEPRLVPSRPGMRKIGEGESHPALPDPEPSDDLPDA